MTTQRAPFIPGDTVKFSHSGSGYPKGTTCTITAIGIDRDDKRSKGAWCVRISLGDKRMYWSANWFVKVSASQKGGKR